MTKAIKLLATANEFYALMLVTCGYWIEQAEDMQVNHTAEKIGKHALILVKQLLFK